MGDLDHQSATDQDIVDWCQRWRQQAMEGGSRHRMLGEWTSNVLLKLNDDAVVKFGVLVSPSEAANQEFGRQTLASEGCPVRVPRVYRFFFSKRVYRRPLAGIDRLPCGGICSWQAALRGAS